MCCGHARMLPRLLPSLGATPRRPSLTAVGGLERLRAWLRAELFLTNFRPVPLTEHAVFRGRVYEKLSPQVGGGTASLLAWLWLATSTGAGATQAQEVVGLEEGQPPLRELREVAPSDSGRDADRLVPLVAEAAGEGHSVLVFCSSRKQCESAAVLIADLLPQVGCGACRRRRRRW